VSFHSDLIAAWPSDIDTLLSASGATYVGRRPQQITRADKEVLIRRLESEDVEPRGSFGVVRAYDYEVQVRVKSLGSDQREKNLQDAVEADLRTLQEAYDGSGRLFSTLSSHDILSISCGEEQIDMDEEIKGLMVGSLRFRWMVAA